MVRREAPGPAVNLCQPRHLGLACMGCCGHGFAGRDAVIAGIRENTRSFTQAGDRLAWGRRVGAALHPSGACANLVEDGEGLVVCALHPARNGGVDLRDPTCDRGHVCRTWHEFARWHEARRGEFLAFLRRRVPDWYDYSMGMESGRLLAEFTAPSPPPGPVG